MFKRHTAAILLAVSATLGPQARALATTLTQHGIVVDTGRGGQLHSVIRPSEPQTRTHCRLKLYSGHKLSARYRSGATVTGELNDDGTMAFHFTALPPEVQKIRFDLMPLAVKQGGKFSIDQGECHSLSDDGPCRRVPFQRRGQADGRRRKRNSFAVEIEHGWQQMQDNRAGT